MCILLACAFCLLYGAPHAHLVDPSLHLSLPPPPGSPPSLALRLSLTSLPFRAPLTFTSLSLHCTSLSLLSVPRFHLSFVPPLHLSNSSVSPLHLSLLFYSITPQTLTSTFPCTSDSWESLPSTYLFSLSFPVCPKSCQTTYMRLCPTLTQEE